MAVHSINLDMITRNNVWQPRYGVAPGYGLPLGANNGFQEVFVSSMAAASAWGLHSYGAGVLRNWLEQFLRRGEHDPNWVELGVEIPAPRSPKRRRLYEVIKRPEGLRNVSWKVFVGVDV